MAQQPDHEGGTKQARELSGAAAGERRRAAGACAPAPVPQVAAIDPETGNEICRGWYVRHMPIMLGPFDKVGPDTYKDLIVRDTFADWNLPRQLEAVEIDPSWKIVRLGDR